MSEILPYYWYDEETKFVYPIFMTKKRIASMKTFSIRAEQDLFITTFFRSGTHWVAHIVKLICNNGEPYKGSIQEAVPLWEGGKPFATDEDLDFVVMQSPRLFKSHFPYAMMPGGLPHTTKAKYIYTARNIKDVAVSVYKFLGSLKGYEYRGSFSEFIDIFLNNRFPYGGWFDNVLSWWEHHDKQNVLFLKYEDMKKDLPATIKSIATFMDYDISPVVVAKIAEMSSFECMNSQSSEKGFLFPSMDRKSKGTPLLRKGQVGDWKSHFTPEQNAYFDAEYAKRMKGIGLQFEFEL